MVVPTGDAWLNGASSTAKNINYSTNEQVALSGSSAYRVPIQFSPAEIQAAVDGELISATLTFDVFSASGFGAGTNVHLYHMVQDWEESAVTFNCAIDSDTSNWAEDCDGPTSWDMTWGGTNPWTTPPIASTVITDSSTTLSFDST